MIKKSIWHHKIVWSFFIKKRHNLSFPRITYFQKKMVLGCKPEWNREAITDFSRLPSLRRLQATPPLQTSLDFASKFSSYSRLYRYFHEVFNTTAENLFFFKVKSSYNFSAVISSVICLSSLLFSARRKC